MTKSLRLSATLAAMLLVACTVFSNTYTVINTADSGAGSLRQAITDANANAGPDTIVFSIPGMGPWTITVSSALPNITGPTVIDGTTQPGFTSGTQSTYVKVGTPFTGTVFTASNVTGLTIKGLDLSFSSPRNGAGISLTTCNQTVIQNNFIRNRNTAISINGGMGHTVQNNDLLASGQDTNNPAIYLLNIPDGGIPVGGVSGNKFGGNANQGFRMNNMSNLIIGDASVSGAHIVLEDNCGLTATGQNGQYVLYFNNVNNITLDNVDISWLGGGAANSWGIVVSNQVSNSTFAIKNCSIKNRVGGISIANGKDAVIQNNDLRGSGGNGTYAVELSNLTEANVNSGIRMSDNLWGRNPTGPVDSDGGLKISNMGNLVIGDATTGVHIKLEDNSGLNTVRGNNTDRGPILLNNVSNITIDNVDAAYTLGSAANSLGIRVNNTGSNGNIAIKNCDVRNRYMGIYCSDGKDYTITGNDLRGSGWEDNAALSLVSIGAGMIPGGVLVHTNLYGRNPAGPVDPNSIGLYVAAMSNLTVGDATTGVEIKIEDNSGMNTFGGNSGDRRGALYLDDVSNVTVDNLDLSYTPGGVPNAFGIFVENETGRNSNISTAHRNVAIKNCDLRNRGQGIRIRGGRDYTVTGNNLRGCGEHGYQALALVNIQSGTMPGGVLAHSNLFGSNGATLSHYGLYIERMEGITIGDAAAGVHIKIEDNSGFNEIAGNDVNSRGALYLNQVNNVTVDNVDCSKATSSQGNSWAIRIVNSAGNMNITIKDCLAGNRQRGIWIDGGRDYTITGNNMVGSGNGNPALELSNVVPGSLAGGIMAAGNTFGTPNFHRGVVISNMRNLLIGDASVAGANFVLEDNCGLNQCVGGDYNNQGALYLGSVTNVTVDNVDCSKSTAGASNSYAIYVANGATNSGVTIKNCKADNRYRGIFCQGGKDYTVQNNTITNSGWDGTACALDFRDVAAGALAGGVLVSGNTFGNVPITANLSRAAVRFDNMRDLTIGDAATGGNVKFEDGNGLTAVGIEQNSAYVVLQFNNVSNSTIDNLDLSYSGANQVGNALRISNQAGLGTITIKDCAMNNRRMGIYIAGGRDYTVTGNNLTGTGQNDANDANNGGAAVWLNGIVKGTLDGGIAMSGNTFGGANANCALRIDDMRGFTIGDAAGDDIRFEDGTSGLANVGNAANSNTFVLYLGQIADVTVNSVDLTRTGGSQLGGGIRVANGNGNKTVAFTNNSVGNRRTGIYISGGSDYTVSGNDLTATGNLIGEPALYFSAITAGALPGGVSISGNTFGGTNANCAVRFENMKNLVIGDASVVGRNVTFEDGTSGLTNTGNAASSGTAVLYFNNISSSSIDNVDLSRTGGVQYGAGIQIVNSDDDQNFTLKNCAVGTRRTGIWIAGGRGYILQNNNLSGSGANANEPALYLDNLVSTSGLSATGNTFGGTNFGAGLLVEDISDLVIGDATVSGAHLVFQPGINLREATSRSIQLDNTNRVKIEALDLTYGSTKAGIGIFVANGTNADIKNVTVQNRIDGVYLAGGSSHTVSCSSFSNNTDAVQADAGAANAIVSQSSFSGNTAYAINAVATLNGENNYFGGAAPIVGTPNGVTAPVDATPFLAVPPAGCPTAGFPEIEVLGNLTLIGDGDLTPSALDHTDFGSTKPGTALVRTFTIKNIGFANLNIASISFSGPNSANFVPGALTPASPIPAGGSATFSVAFTPGATGLATATLNISCDDTDEAAFDVAVQGTGKNALVVTKTADTNDGVCDADCSLREAITVANSNADADVIEFNIGSGAQTITHTSAFPNITQPLTIDGTTQPGYAGTPLITVNSNSSLTTFNVLNITGFTLKSMNLSRPDANFDGTAINLTNCNTVTIQNNVMRNRLSGIVTNGGYDYTIQNNDVKNTGWRESEPAIWLRSLTSRNIAGGVTMSGNVWGDLAGANNYQAGCALRMDNMNGLVIGDASVSGRHITIEDGTSGWNDVQAVATFSGHVTVLYLSNVADITVDNVDMSLNSTTQNGMAVTIASGSRNVTIKNCPMQYRYRGINCEGGQDYTLQSNDIRNTGYGNEFAAIRLNGVTAGSIPAGVAAAGNQFGGTASYLGTALRVLNMTGLVIGDAGVAGAHIVIPDGELSDFKGTNNGGHDEILSFSNVSDLTIDNVDLTHGTVGNSGHAISVVNTANNRNVTIKNCAIQYRFRGIFLSGGKDYTVQNNNLAHTGPDVNNPAIYLNGIRPGVLAAGITASGNTFGYTAGGVNAKTALRVSGMDGLLIGDAGVAGAHIVIEDNSGAKDLNNTGDNEPAIYMSAVSNITVDNVDVSRTPSGRAGAGIWVENNGSSLYRNVTIKNCKIQQRHTSIWVNGGKDAVIQNNDLRYSGFYTSRPAIYLNNLQPGTLPGGISMSGNLFGGTANGSIAHMGITIANMSDLVISDGSPGGANIVLEDLSGLNEIVGEDQNSRGCLYLSNVRNVQINSVDLSKATGSQANSFALMVENGINVSATNNSGANRYRGFVFSAGRDLTITGNNLTSSGQSRDNPALYLNSIQPGSIHPVSGISASGNTFGGSAVRTALRLDNMKNVLIGDASVTGAHIVVEDASGMNNCTQVDNNSEHPVIYMASVSDITVDNVDASRPSGKDKGGIWVSNGATTNFGNVAIKNCNFNNHRRGIFISGGRDYTVQNNSMLNGGLDASEPAIYLQNIQSNNLAGGILMSGNTFGGTSAFAGVRFENMRDLNIGDAGTGGNVKIEDNSGLNNMGGNATSSGYYVLQLVNVFNAKVDNVDVSRPVGATPAQDLTGIRVDNGAAYGPVTIKNCDVRRHRIGINIQGGKDYTVTGNDLRGCGPGNSFTEPALYFSNITQIDGTVPMGIAASGNLFGTTDGIVSNLGLRMDNLCGIRISDGTVANTNIALEPANGIKAVTGTSNAVIYLSNNSGMTLEKLDLEFTGTQSGTGIRIQNSNAGQYDFTIKGNLLKNRRSGLSVLNGADYTITGNNFQMTGAADDEPAIRLEHVAEGALYGGVSISGNTFGGSGAAFGLKFVNMSNLKISDGSLAGANVNLGAWAANGIGELTTGNALHLSGICNALVSTLDLSRSGATRQGSGLRLTDGMGNTIEKVFVQGRDAGIVVNGSVSETIRCNTVYDNNFGFDFPNNTTISGLTFQQNSMHCNTTGLRNQRSAALGTLNAQSNYWGAAAGPVNLGGTGNGYTNTNGGTVNAASFLTAAAACAPILPNADVLANTLLIEDGDMTPSFNDNTLVCGTPVGLSRTITYTIKNNGGGTIRLDSASPVSTTPATVFTVTTQPADLELAPGESTTFDINFTPSGFGTFLATVDIQNRTCDNDPYNFSVQGQGCLAYNATLSGTPGICFGQPAMISIHISGGTAPFTIKLSDGSTRIVNSTGTHTLTVSPAANTSYSLVQVYDANNCCADLFGSATVTVNPLPTPAITITETSGSNNDDGILCAGASATLDAGVYPMYAWTPSGNAQTINATVSGVYTVTVTDANSCQNTASATIVVNPNPTPTIVETDNSGTADDNIICTGGTATLDAGGGYTSYAWAPSGSNQTLAVSAGGTYTVVVTDTNGCTGTDDQAIQENALPVAALSGALLVCPGTTSTMINLNITAGIAPFTVTLSDASVHNVLAPGMSTLSVTVAGPGANSFSISSITGAGGCAGISSGTATVDFGSAGEVEISGNGTPISIGDNMPDPADHTDFGPVAVGGNFTRTFTITNSHPTLALLISGVNITGSTDFTLMTPPAGTVAANGGTTTFVVKFLPTALGFATATVLVNSSDCDEQPYDFAVQGTGAEPGAALNFDGINDFVSAPDAGNLDLGYNLTLEAWVKPESFSAYNMIIDKRDLADASANYGLTLNYGKPMFYFWNGGNLSFHIATNAIALNTLTHLAATYDGAKVRIFVNGTQVYAQTETDVPPSNNQPLSIGRNQVTLQYFDGSIDEVRIWNTVRSCEEIRQLRNCEMTGSETGLVAYYKFNQGLANEDNSTVTTLTDAAGGDNNGTLNGFALTGATSNWVTPGGVTTGTSCPAAITAPEADLLGHDNTPLADGTTGTSVAQGTNLGSVNLGGSSTAKTFTIENNGTAALNVSIIAGSDPQFTLTALSPAGPIPAGMSATFTLTFTPLALGAQNATITINNDDCDEATYTFAVTGTGACVAPSFTTCPAAPVTATTATGTCAAPVNYTVTEAGIPAPVLSYAFAGATTGSGSGTGTGSTFNKGNTIVTVTATSICSPPATCSFTVTVTDNEKPQITCAGPVTVNTTAGLCTGTAILTAPTVTDNCPFGGNGLNFDGNDDQVVTEAYSGTSFTGDLTLECWFKGSSLNGRSLFGRGYQQEFDLALWSNQLNYYHGNGSVWVNPTFSYVFADNTWYHVAVVRNASAQTVSLYVNGVFQQTLSYGAPLPVAQTAAFRIGRRVVGNPLLGSIDEVRVWTVARTPAQIAGNWNQELTAQPGLFALYHLNEGSANGNNPGVTTAADASGNAHDGTLTHFALSGTSSNWVVGAFGGVTNNAPATYPKGNTTVTWTATDASGNTETCQQTVTVTDNQPPTVICPSNQTVPPTISSPCSAVVNAINASFNDNCTGTTLAYTLSGATTASGSGQASGQAFLNGATTVTYTVTDGASLTSSCMFTVTVTNCNLLFSGTILWEDDAVSGVKDATVNIAGASSGSDATGVNGDFEAAVPYATGDFTVKPVKNINRLNGVTAADALAIQQHLTNINPITNPYKMIAADVNRSNGLSTIDATIINQCLLGNPAANNIFNVFWRFVPQTWTPVLPPWGFPEQINLTGVSTNQSGLDFYGVKIGDVTAAYANPANFGAPEASGLVWRVQDRMLQAGETVEAEFRADQLDDVAAMQFALQFDPSVLQFDGVEILGGLPVSMDNFGLFNISEGEIRVVWTGEKGLPIPEAAAVFRLRFTVREGGGRLSEVLGLNDEVLAGRVYNSALAESGVMLRFGEASSVMGGEPGAPGWSLHAMPNPFSKQTTISFTLHETTEAQLRIFNPEGRELWRLDKTYPAGYHAETVRMEDLDASGLLFYELTTLRGKQTKKLVAVRL